MKIAHIIGTFPALSQTFITNQITGQIDRGHTVEVLAYRSENHGIIHDDVQRYGLVDRTHYIKRREDIMPENIFFRYLKTGKYLLSVENANKKSLIKTLDIRRYGSSALLLNRFYTALLYNDLNISKYDIVHAHFGPRGITASFLKEIGLIKAPIVTTFYGYDVSSYVKKNGTRVYRNLFAKADLLLVLSNEMKNELIELGCPEHKIKVHHLGINPDLFAYTDRKRKQGDCVQLITVARFVEKKGLQYAIEAIAQIRKKYPKIRYNIIGDGPLRAEIEALIKKFQLEDIIYIHGWKTQQEIVRMLAESDIFIAPSVTAPDGDREGTPTVLMEAQAQGLPVISTYHSGIPEVVKDGITGFLVPERDVNKLAENICYLIENPDLIQQFGKAGRDHIAEEFNINLLTDKLLEYYKTIRENNLLIAQ